MKEFIEKYNDRIHGVLSCFDRMLFRGYLPIMSGWQMAQFFTHGGSSENNVLLLGHGPKRVLNRYSIQERGSLKRALPAIAESQHVVLWRQGSHELSWKKNPVQL